MNESTKISYPYLKWDDKQLSVQFVKLDLTDKQACIDAINEVESNIPPSGFIEWQCYKNMVIPNEWGGRTEFIDMFLEILNDPIRPQNRHKSTTGFRVYGSQNKLGNWLKGTK